MPVWLHISHNRCCLRQLSYLVIARLSHTVLRNMMDAKVIWIGYQCRPVYSKGYPHGSTDVHDGACYESSHCNSYITARAFESWRLEGQRGRRGRARQEGIVVMALRVALEYTRMLRAVAEDVEHGRAGKQTRTFWTRMLTKSEGKERDSFTHITRGARLLKLNYHAAGPQRQLSLQSSEYHRWLERNISTTTPAAYDKQ